LDKFARVVHNVASCSPLHFKRIGLKGNTHSMFIRKKLDWNSQGLNIGVFIINMPTWEIGCLPHHILTPNPLNTPKSTSHASVGDFIYKSNSSHKKIPTFVMIPLEFHHVSQSPFIVMNQFGIIMMESYIPLHQLHL